MGVLRHAPTPPALRAVALVRCLATIVAVLALAGSAFAQSDTGEVDERVIKAAYLARFIEYVDWPRTALPNPDTPYTIGVAGDPLLVDALHHIVVDRHVNGHPLRVVSVGPGETPPGVHLLFIAASSEQAFHDALPAPDSPVLVVSEFPGALANGAAVNFVVLDGHLRFEVSVPNAQRRHLKLGAGLLSVAVNIRRAGS
jgi:hypothetical protein